MEKSKAVARLLELQKQRIAKTFGSIKSSKVVRGVTTAALVFGVATIMSGCRMGFDNHGLYCIVPGQENQQGVTTQAPVEENSPQITIDGKDYIIDDDGNYIYIENVEGDVYIGDNHDCDHDHYVKEEKPAETAKPDKEDKPSSKPSNNQKPTDTQKPNNNGNNGNNGNTGVTPPTTDRPDTPIDPPATDTPDIPDIPDQPDIPGDTDVPVDTTNALDRIFRELTGNDEVTVVSVYSQNKGGKLHDVEMNDYYNNSTYTGVAVTYVLSNGETYTIQATLDDAESVKNGETFYLDGKTASDNSGVINIANSELANINSWQNNSVNQNTTKTQAEQTEDTNSEAFSAIQNYLNVKQNTSEAESSQAPVAPDFGTSTEETTSDGQNAAQSFAEMLAKMHADKTSGNDGMEQ